MLKIFVVIDIHTEEIVCKIPVDLLELKVAGLGEIEAIRVLSSKIAFVEEDMIRIINN